MYICKNHGRTSLQETTAGTHQNCESSMNVLILTYGQLVLEIAGVLS